MSGFLAGACPPTGYVHDTLVVERWLVSCVIVGAATALGGATHVRVSDACEVLPYRETSRSITASCPGSNVSWRFAGSAVQVPPATRYWNVMPVSAAGVKFSATVHVVLVPRHCPTVVNGVPDHMGLLGLVAAVTAAEGRETLLGPTALTVNVYSLASESPTMVALVPDTDTSSVGVVHAGAGLTLHLYTR